MACSSIGLSGYTSCDVKGSGGIEKILIAEYKSLDLSGATITGGKIVTLNFFSGYSGYIYDFVQNNISRLDDPVSSGGATVLPVYQPTITLQFNKMSDLLSEEIYKLGLTKLVAIVQDENDQYFLVGKKTGLDMIASEGFTTGAIYDDSNGITIVLQGAENHSVYPIDISATSNVDSNILSHFGF